jgi:hypothetical protein
MVSTIGQDKGKGLPMGYGWRIRGKDRGMQNHTLANTTPLGGLLKRVGVCEGYGLKKIKMLLIGL